MPQPHNAGDVLLTLHKNVLGSALASAVDVKAIIDKTEGLDKLVACVRSLLKIESAPEPLHHPLNPNRNVAE